MASMKALTPASLPAPLARYAHGVEIPPGWRVVRTSGQLGVAPDGRVPADARAQADLCFAAVREILADAGMGPGDVAHVTGYVTDRAHMAAYMAARDAFVGDAARLPASTLLIVAGFTRAEFLVEVEVMAAAP